jgi:hypothetical protein
MTIVAKTACAIAALGFMAVQAAAAELELRWVKPDGAVVSEKTLTTEELEALPQTTFTTNTPWTTAPTEFAGPALAELAGLGPKATKAEIVAINDYSAEILAEDWTDHGATLTVRLDGEYMKIRDKGPFWLMYPIDQDPKTLNTQLYHSRMVWQVQSIDFMVD